MRDRRGSQEVPEDKEQEERRKRRLHKALGYGLLAGGLGLRYSGLAAGLPAIWAQAKAGVRASEIAKAAPQVESLSHLKDFLKGKGVSGENIKHWNPQRLPWPLKAYFRPENFSMFAGHLVGAERGPKTVIEHEGGHLLRGHGDLPGLFKRYLGKHGIGYKRFILKPELEAWREVAPGPERREMRRAALASYKAGQNVARLRGLLLPSHTAVLAGLALLGTSRKKKKKDTAGG